MPTKPPSSLSDAGFDFPMAIQAVRSGAKDLDDATATLLARLSPEERLWLLDGDEEFWPGLYGMNFEGYNLRPYVHGAVPRLQIPGVRFSDGPRGCVMGQSTAFPVAMARGASWDVSLEQRIGRAIGRECKAQGANFFGGVCINLPRHPAWGRIQETFGEDPVILGEMGAALTRGVQESVMACVKHYALNSMENARFQVDVKVADDVLREVYLPHFKRIVEEGVASVMSSYNSVRGEFAGQNKELLLDILRGEWGFKGFVISDFLFGLRDASLSLKSGLDIEAPLRQQRAQKLPEALKNGEINDADVDRAGTAILRRIIEDESLRGGSGPGQDIVFCNEHRLLAREAAVKSMVLLKNGNVDGAPLLPLSGSAISKVAVLGRLADSKDTGDRGSSAVRCPEVASTYEGLKAALPHATVALEGSDEAGKIKAAAAAADVAVVVVGYNFIDEGEYTAPAFDTNPALKSVLPPHDGTKEADAVYDRLMHPQPTPEDIGKDNYGLGAGGDRKSLRLRPQDVEVIRAAAAANPRTVVNIVAAGAVIIEEWKDHPAAIVLNWYAGCEGGPALADLLLGQENFGGRLPFSVPTCEEHLPAYDIDAREIEYDRWFGQRLLDRIGVPAAYPLGFGLSYTTFTVSGLEVEKAVEKDGLQVRVCVVNTGARAGRYIAQVYGTVEVPDWPKRSLLGFQVVSLEPREERNLEIRASTRPLQRWNSGSWTMVSDEVDIVVGAHCGDKESAKGMVTL